MEFDTNIDSLIKSYPSLQRLPDKNRIKCTWTQHEMPARVDAIEKYIQGKKYQQLLKKKLDTDYSDKFKEFLEPSTKKNHERQLFCKLTWRHLNKEPHHIMRHIEGKRFKRAHVLWQECQVNGTEYVPIGRRKKKQQMGNDDDQYVDLSDDEIVIEGDDDDDLSDLYPDFRRLRASDSEAGSAERDGASGTKRKAQTSQMKKPKKLAAPNSKRMRSSDEKIPNGDNSIESTQTITLVI